MKTARRLLAAVLALGFSGVALAQQPVGVATPGMGSLGHAVGTAIAKEVQEKAGVPTVVQPYSGTAAFFPLLDQGAVQFGIAAYVEGAFAVMGTGPSEGKPTPNVRMVANLAPALLGLFVRRDSQIRTVQDMKGSRFPVGWVAFPIAVPFINAMLATGGLNMAGSDFKPHPVPQILRGADDFVAGRTDVGYFAVGAGKMAEINAAVQGGIRFVSLGDTPAAVAAMRKHAPGADIVRLQPAPHLAGIVEPTNVMAVDYVLFAGAKTPDDVVYKAVIAMHANQQSMAASNPFLKDFNPAKMAKAYKEVRYHPGAEKAYREKGQWPPKE
jgi:TRAP transporter TAXI family solute receptor